MMIGRMFSAWFLSILLSTLATAATPAAAPSKENPAQHVDHLLASELHWLSASNHVELAPRTGDEIFLRRAYLDLVGELPSPSEITLFVLDPTADKRTKVIDRLLADERYGKNWARYWRDVIMYRRVEDRALLVLRPVEQFLTEQLNSNAGWDKIAQEFIEAKGNIAEHGETALILAQMTDANDVASEVSRIFMGVQIQCAQCHDHPTDRWKRQQFHEFAAFFPRTAPRPIIVDGMMRGIEIVSIDVEPRFRRPNFQNYINLEHYMPDLKDPSSKGKVMTPVFFATGQKLATGSTDKERRTKIAEWISARGNGWFAKALVNRMWAELVGEGFYEPVDDIGPDRQCTAPQTIEYLANQFALHHYDIKWLLRTIMETAAYQRESRPRRLPNETPFVANCSQRLRGDQVLDILCDALGVDPSLLGFGGGRPGYAFAQFGPRYTFNTSFGYDPSVRRDEVTGSIPQALVMMNSPLITRALDGKNRQTVLGKLLVQTADDEQVAVDLYLRCLAREPSQSELTVCREHIRTVGDRAQAFEDILWALVNRTEFLHRN
jgi:hypothetical protein